MSSKICWEFNEPNIIKPVLDNGSDKEVSKQLEAMANFYFELTRYKDSITCAEGLRIDSFYGDKPNGSIMTTIYSLERDLKEFMKYGVAFSAIVFRDLRKIIEDNYLLLKTTDFEVDADSDKRFSELLNLVDEYRKVIAKQGDKNESFFSIPAVEFDELAKDCGYNDYELRDLRRELADGKYIYKSGDRFTVLERVKDKPVRVIRFYLDKLEAAVNKEKSDA